MNSSVKSVIKKVKKKIDKKRLKHSLKVAETAEKLAVSEDVNPEKAYLAGILHDYAKSVDKGKLKKLAAKSLWEIDRYEYLIPEVLHAPVGAYLVKKEFSIKDKQILEAIRFHTIGSPKMDKLAKIIFISDIIEPNRKFSGIEQIRKSVKINLDKGIIKACNHAIKYNIEKKRLLHPNTIELRNKLLKEDGDGEKSQE